MALLAFAACNEHAAKPLETGDPGHGPHYDYPVFGVNKDVDILFVIDDSGSMAEEQLALTSAFAAMVEVLERPEVAARYRIGVTTTDNGNPWCWDGDPEAGMLQLSSCHGRPEDFEPLDGGTIDPVSHPCRSACPEAWASIETLPTAIEGSEEVRPRPWIERTYEGSNLPEGLTPTQAFQCIAPQGITGCGFESPLESMWKALRRSQDQNEPAHGFVRDHAILSIVHVTDEMDCSYNTDWETIFLPDGDRVFWSNPEEATPTSAVCWNAGVACEGESPYEGCSVVDLDVEGNEVSEDEADELAVLRPVSRYVDLLEELESNKQVITPDQQVLVSVIGGIEPEGLVFEDAADPEFQRLHGIGPGCEGPNGAAVPPMRLREVAEAFQVGDDRNMFSVCRDDYSAAMTAIAESIAAQIRPACMPACVADTDPSTEEVEPSCSFTQEAPRSDGTFDEVDVPPCEPGEVLPEGHDVCFEPLVGDERSDFCAEIGFNLELRFVRRPGVPVPEGITISGVCNLSDDRRSDCPDLP